MYYFRFVVGANRILFMCRDGAQAWDVKDFLVQQDNCESVEIEGKTYYCKGAKKVSEMCQKRVCKWFIHDERFGFVCLSVDQQFCFVFVIDSWVIFLKVWVRQRMQSRILKLQVFSYPCLSFSAITTLPTKWVFSFADIQSLATKIQQK